MMSSMLIGVVCALDNSHYREPAMTVEHWLVGAAFALGYAGGLFYFLQPDRFHKLATLMMASIQ